MVLTINAALRDAGLVVGDIDAIVPQAVSIPKHDTADLEALKEVFGARLSSMELVTLSLMRGDCAAGAPCLHHQNLPPRVHGGGEEPAARDAALRHVLVCTGSLAGQKTAVVLSRAE